MKSNYLFLLSALAVFTACNEQETMTSEQGNAVTFKTFVSPQGRGVAASQDDKANLQQNFGVFAYRNANGVADASTPPNTLYNELVTYTPGIGFSYTNTIYWPANDKLGFYAYSPYSAGGTGTDGISNFVPANNTTNGTPGFTFTVNNNVDNQIDLLTAKTEGLSGGTVPLAFLHALSKVELQAHTSAINYRVAIMGVKLTGIYSTGDFRFNGVPTSWTNQRTEADYTGAVLTTGNSQPNGAGVPAAVIVYNNNNSEYTNVTNPTNALYLLPQALGANARLVVTYNIYNTQTGNLISNQTSQDLVLDISDESLTLSGLVKWDRSHRIIYRLNFFPRESGPGSEIKFEATVTDWSIEYGDFS